MFNILDLCSRYEHRQMYTDMHSVIRTYVLYVHTHLSLTLSSQTEHEILHVLR